MTDLIPVPDMQMVWIRLLAPKSPSFTFPEESLRMLAPGGTKQNELRVIQDPLESFQYLSERGYRRSGGLVNADSKVPAQFMS